MTKTTRAAQQAWPVAGGLTDDPLAHSCDRRSWLAIRWILVTEYVQCDTMVSGVGDESESARPPSIAFLEKAEVGLPGDLRTCWLLSVAM